MGIYGVLPFIRLGQRSSRLHEQDNNITVTYSGNFIKDLSREIFPKIGENGHKSDSIPPISIMSPVNDSSITVSFNCEIKAT